MDDLCVFAEFAKLAGDAIVKSRAQADYQIRLAKRHICGVAAMHSYHAEAVFIIASHSPQRHKGFNDRYLRKLAKLAHQLACARADDAASDVEDRFFGISD